IPLDILGHTRATLTEPTRMPSKRMSLAYVDYVPALYTHHPSLLPIKWLSEASRLAQGGWQQPPQAGKFIKLSHLEENSVNHQIFERTLRPIVFHRACLFKRHLPTSSSAWSLTSDQVGIPAELKHINKQRKRNQQGLP
ncbi:hypothetical protein P154DRAFT_451064, partial [Amniculicola lignicola CBS 123094]